MLPVEILEGSVWSMRYTGEKDDIFTLLLDKWQDPEYIHNYIYDHKDQIEANPFWDNCSFQDVMSSAINEAKNLEGYFIQLYRNSEQGISPTLEEKFVLLDKKLRPDEVITRRKMYGKLRHTYPPSLLRLYALRLESYEGDPPIYIITGGGIKLIDDMQTPELEDEIKRLRKVRTWLERKGIKTKEQFFTYINYYDQE